MRRKAAILILAAFVAAGLVVVIATRSKKGFTFMAGKQPTRVVRFKKGVVKFYEFRGQWRIFRDGAVGELRGRKWKQEFSEPNREIWSFGDQAIHLSQGRRSSGPDRGWISVMEDDSDPGLWDRFLDRVGF